MDKYLSLDIVLVKSKRISTKTFCFLQTLGSVILYDILVNQTPATEEEALRNETGT
jgi:hypothetical protein